MSVQRHPSQKKNHLLNKLLVILPANDEITGGGQRKTYLKQKKMKNILRWFCFPSIDTSGKSAPFGGIFVEIFVNSYKIFTSSNVCQKCVQIYKFSLKSPQVVYLSQIKTNFSIK